MAQNRRKKVGPADAITNTSIARSWTVFGPFSALVLLAMMSAPLLLWGNLYPPQTLPYWMWGSIAVAIIALASMLKWQPIQKLPALFRNALVKPPPIVFTGLVFILASALSATVALAVFHGAGNTTDEYAQRFHAGVLLSGHLTWRVDPNPEFFSMDTVIDQGRWYSHFPIGGPVVIALGTLLGGPWVLSALLTGLAAAALYQFVRVTFGEAQARVAAIIFCMSPSIFIMGGTWMNHVPVLCLTCGMLAALAHWDRASSVRAESIYAALIGLAIGFVATIRPLDAVVLALVVGVFQLWVIAHAPRKIFSLGAQVALGFLGALPVLVANAKTTGNALRFAYDVQWGAGHGIGFHVDPYGQPYTVQMAFERAITYVGEWNMFVTAWPIPAVLLVVIALFALRRPTKWDVLLVMLFAVQLFAYACFWGQGELLGPRFLHNVMPVAIIFIARIPWLFRDAFGARGRQVGSAMLFACMVIAALSFRSPFSPWGLVRQAGAARGSMRLDVASSVREAGVHNAVVVLSEPFSARLTRRLWGLHISRSETAQLLKNRDACSLLAGVAEAENDTHSPPEKLALVHAAALFTGDDAALAVGDALLNSKASVTPECNAEFESDTRGGFIPYGAALPLVAVDANGAVAGDIVYIADLGGHNKALYTRFANRDWYRISSQTGSDGKLSAVVTPYVRGDE